MENFQIRSYGKSELALCYSPDITESAARRKLMRWIDRKPGRWGRCGLPDTMSCHTLSCPLR